MGLVRGRTGERRAFGDVGFKTGGLGPVGICLVALAFSPLAAQGQSAPDAGRDPEVAADPATPDTANDRPGSGAANALPTLTPPRLLEAPSVTLPEDAAPLPAGAAVTLELVVEADGSVGDATVVTGLRDDVDAVVLTAARALTFAPATRDGRAIAARIRFRFAISPPAAPPDDNAASPADGGEDPSGTAAADPDPSASPRDPNDGTAGTPTALPARPGDQTAGDEPAEAIEIFEARAVVARRETGAATRITLIGEELTTVPGTFGEPLRVVATFPGVSRTPFGLGYFLVRGASFENSGFLVDGFPVPLLYHVGAGPAVISSRLVTELDFYPGGYPVRYGRFTAGLISVTTGSPEVEVPHLEAEIDLFRASALAVVPYGDGRGVVSAAYRRSYYELILPLIVDGVDLAFTDWQLRVDHRLTERLTASLFYFGSDDVFDASEAAGVGTSTASTRTGFGYGFERLIGKLELRLPGRGKLTWAATYGFDDTLVRRSEPGGVNLHAEVDGTYLGERLELSMPHSEMFETTVGFDVAATLYDALSSLPTPPGVGEYPKPLLDPRVSDVRLELVSLGAASYLEELFRAGPLELTTGLRLDMMRYGRTSQMVFDPRGVMRLHASDAVAAKLATGLFAQPPQPFQIDPSFGNPEMRPSRSWQSSTGVEITLPQALEIESSLFYSAMYNMARTTNELVADENGDLHRQIYLDDGEGRSYGFEFLFRRKVEEGLYGWLSYTLAWSERFVEGGETVPFFFDQRHTLNLAISYRLDRWRFGARFTLASGRPNRPVVGSIYDADADRYIPLRGGFTERLPTYHQLDLRIDRDFAVWGMEGSVYLDVLNAYNAQNAEAVFWQYDFQKSTPLPGLPILATIGVRLEYDP